MSTDIVPQVPAPATDFVPEVFGRLTTLDAGYMVDFGTYRMTCTMVRCECGTVKQVYRKNLKSGNTRSCGCLHNELLVADNTTHGKVKTPEYVAWRSMLNRCNNPKQKYYSDYGGRGIHVFAEWDCSSGFAAWFRYMGPRPSEKHSLDRFPDPNGNYEPGNVRWATAKEQQNNRRDNRIIEHNGQGKTLAQWAELTGIHRATITKRLELGWTVEKALTTPARKTRNKK